MKKGITPLVAIIILILITVVLVISAWTYVNQKMIEVVDSYCINDKVTIIIQNAGISKIILSTKLNYGNPIQLGEILVSKEGQNITGLFDKEFINPGEVAIFNDLSCEGVCNYRLIPTSGLSKTCTVYCKK